ncbi:hypothetical protein BKA66DRAFT_567011 [Pyrenochaeta sp. MPI-SDFR-AT-0127]|nr:hypothetical protein BKA66DRAFT_567011 [Pyrenochaeta sp. MPI-SDFR-AT-0127]
MNTIADNLYDVDGALSLEPSQSNAVRPSESASQVSAAPSTTTLSSTSSLGKRSRKFRSDIWVHFREAVCNEVRNYQSGLYYYCKYCSGRYTNSKSAWTHLQSAYGIAKPDEDGLASKKAATEGALVRGFAATEAKMAAQRERVAKAAMGDCISRERFNEALVRLITVRNLPLSAVEWPELEDLLKATNPAVEGQLL